MNLNDSKPVFLQIKQWIEDHILDEEWKKDFQITSIREMIVNFRVNANTIVRTYEKLEAEGTVYSIRGVGYFVSENSRNKILENRQKEFYQDILPSFLHQVKVLKIDKDEIIKILKNETKQ